jgi:hypothetical protein
VTVKASGRAVGTGVGGTDVAVGGTGVTGTGLAGEIGVAVGVACLVAITSLVTTTVFVGAGLSPHAATPNDMDSRTSKVNVLSFIAFFLFVNGSGISSRHHFPPSFSQQFNPS